MNLIDRLIVASNQVASEKGKAQYVVVGSKLARQMEKLTADLERIQRKEKITDIYGEDRAGEDREIDYED